MKIRVFFCNKCKSSAYTTDGTEPIMCVAPFSARTSGICGGGYTEVTDKVDWILASEVERVIEERIRQITDEELEKEYSTDLATLCNIHNIPIKFDYLQGDLIETFQYHNRLRHEGAKWFRNRIKGKQ